VPDEESQRRSQLALAAWRAEPQLKLEDEEYDEDDDVDAEDTVLRLDDVGLTRRLRAAFVAATGKFDVRKAVAVAWLFYEYKEESALHHGGLLAGDNCDYGDGSYPANAVNLRACEWLDYKHEELPLFHALRLVGVEALKELGGRFSEFVRKTFKAMKLGFDFMPPNGIRATDWKAVATGLYPAAFAAWCDQIKEVKAAEALAEARWRAAQAAERAEQRARDARKQAAAKERAKERAARPASREARAKQRGKKRAREVK